MFYTILFSALAVLLVIAGLTVFSRNRRELDSEASYEAATSDGKKQARKAKRVQSKNARRKRK